MSSYILIFSFAFMNWSTYAILVDLDINISPSSCFNLFAIILKSVVFPLPFAPTNPILWLFSIFKDTSFSIRSLPKYLVILL